MSREIDVLIPTYDRPAPLAVTLTTLVGQTFRDFRVVLSDQTGEDGEGTDARVVQAVVEVLRFQGVPVEIHENLPRRGVAHQRQFLLDQADAPPRAVSRRRPDSRIRRPGDNARGHRGGRVWLRRLFRRQSEVP